MNICILLALVYIIGGVGILIMKKLQPEDKISGKRETPQQGQEEDNSTFSLRF